MVYSWNLGVISLAFCKNLMTDNKDKLAHEIIA